MSREHKPIPEFEIVRTISILLLLLHHSGFYSLELFGLPLKGLSPFFEAFLLGSFFLISGYFLEVSLQNSGGDVVKFIRSRVLRIYPPYLAALLLYVFVLGFTLKTRFDWLVYVSGAQFIFAPGSAKPILTLWYVGAILLYYALFLVIWKVAPNVRLLVMLAGTIFFLVLFIHFRTGLIDPRFFKYYFVFLAGMLLARGGESGFALSERGVWWKGALLMIGAWAFSVVLRLDLPITSAAYILVSFVFISAGASFLFALVARAGVVTPWRWVTAISYASYFVYLFHRPFWELIEGPIPIPDLQYQILFRLVPASILVLIVCYYLQHLYDLLSSRVVEKLNR